LYLEHIALIKSTCFSVGKILLLADKSIVEPSCETGAAYNSKDEPV
jgi:hypothetical protein